MSYSPMDLDSSLDDLIKKRHSTSKNNNKNSFKSHNNSNNNRHKKNNNNNQSRPVIQTNSAKITKHTPPRSNINSRLSNGSIGPLFTAKNKQQQQKQKQQADPSKIIITKNISSRLGPSTVQKKTESRNPVITSRLGNSQARNLTPNRLANPQNTVLSRVEVPPISSTLSSRLGSNNVISFNPEFRRNQQSIRLDNDYEERPYQGFTIRGISNTKEMPKPITIKGGSGPTTVLITGLDRGTNSDDVRITLEQFGNILHCEVLRSSTGQSLGEAEVEFSTKSAALDCIAMMDDRIIDGERVHVILREPKPLPNYSQQQIRSVISAPASGKLYSDHMSSSRYDIQRL